MSEKTLIFDIQDNIATITMNKPERKNALDKEMIDLWVNALDECRENKDISCLLYTSPSPRDRG